MNNRENKVDEMDPAPLNSVRFTSHDVTSDQPSSSAVEQYLRIALRWRWVIGGIAAAAILLGLIITLLMTPRYTAEATIEISREAGQVTDFQGVETEVSLADEEFYQTQYGLLRSRSLAERVASDLNLIDDPEFFEIFGINDSSDEPFQKVNGRYALQGREERRRLAGELLLDNLSIDPTRLSRLTDIRFSSPDPVFSAKIVNTWADTFIKTNLERKLQSTSYGREVLKRQLAETKEQLDESQRQLVTYASEEEIINLPANTTGGQERSIVADNLASLNAELSRATSDRIAAEARFRGAGTAGASSEALTNTAISNLRQRRAELAAQYEQLMVQFEPGYPQARAIQGQIDSLDAAIAREEARVGGSLQAEYRQAVQREADLASRVAQLKDEYLDLRRRSIQYNIYEQEVDTNQALYDGLLKRFEEIGVAGGVGVNNIAVVDTADVPTEPSSPRLIVNLVLAALGGLILGAAAALVLEQLDQSVGDPSSLPRRIGLPLLGTVPIVEGAEPAELLRDRKSALVDAYLAIQTSLSFTTEHGLPRVFAVTSTRPAEGKSTTSLALATSAARTKRKVLLIDADMRSPSVQHLVGTEHSAGLSNFLSGDDSLEGQILHIEALGMDVMLAGPTPPNAAELLTGKRLSVLLERLRERYDHVVIDTPPVLGLADAPIIASQVDGVVYVIESQGVRIGNIRTALQRLRATDSRILGGVVTKVNVKKSYGDYGYEYGYGYGRDEELKTE